MFWTIYDCAHKKKNKKITYKKNFIRSGDGVGDFAAKLCT